MKEQRDLVQGLLRKAESDLNALEGALSTGAMDAPCFHAQQAAEKFLKAFLTFSETEYPFTHNLSKLVELRRERPFVSESPGPRGTPHPLRRRAEIRP